MSRILKHYELSDKDYNKKLKHEFMCECGRDYVHLSQPDDETEYYAIITFECECGKQTELKFPVN
jgi:hypothetical protein